MNRRLVLLSLVVATWGGLSISHGRAAAVAFGSGVNQFAIEFVTIGNPGNAADMTGTPTPDQTGGVGVGGVGYIYGIGKYEVSRGMITKANALGGLGINLQSSTSPGFTDPDRAATGIHWNEAARFVNWLNTSQGYTPAYKFAIQPGDANYVISTSSSATVNANILLWEPGDLGYNAANPFRNSNARYVLPSIDEWYKAAYYDPNHGGLGIGDYWNYPTGSDTTPTAVAGGVLPDTVVTGNSSGGSPAYIFDAGGLSPYGTMAQAGNVLEWMETESDLLNNLASGNRANRGGHWYNTVGPNGPVFQAHFQIGSGSPSTGSMSFGFRVAAVEPVPEPASMLLVMGGVVVVYMSLRTGSGERNEK